MVVVAGLRRAVGALGLAVGLCAVADGAAHGAPVAKQPKATATTAVTPDWRDEEPSVETRTVANWVFASRDASGRPFAIVDKKQARIYVFDARGALAGAAPALLGLTKGDDSAPGVAQRAANGSIGRDERTTPAGRFEAEPGRNLHGEAIVWIDYTAAVAIHRLRPAPAVERRPQRLASRAPDDNRISLGCVIVSADFFDTVVAPLLGSHRGVVYVLPDARSLQATFGDGADDAL